MEDNKKPGMPPLPPGFMKMAPVQPPPFPGAAKPALPPMPGGPQLPPVAPQPVFQAPAPAPMPAAAAPVRETGSDDAAKMKEEKDRLEKRIAEMEKLVSQEKEKALLATLKNQQDEALSSKVESSLKDIQEKLRRDRHEQEAQEERLSLKAKIKELEGRLVSERETWMQTLKSQMQERETQSKDVEGHFIFRLQEMERRWLDEKAQWQKTISQKEEEVRDLRRAAEKQKELEDELHRAAFDKEMQAKEAAKLREEISKLEKDKAAVEAYIKSMPERERESSDIKVENAVLRAREEKARDEVKLAEERFRRDADALQKEMGRLQSEIGTIADRKNAEKEEEIRKIHARHQGELQEKEKLLADVSGEKIRAISELLKLKGMLSRVQAINAVLEKERQGLRAEKMQMAQAMAANIEDVRKYKSESEGLKAAHQAEFQKFKTNFEAEAEARHSAQLGELENRLKAELMAAERKHQSELAKVRADAALELEHRLLEMRNKYEAGAGEIRAGVKNELEREYAAEAAKLKAALSQAEDEKIRLQTEVKRAEAEMGAFNERLTLTRKDFEDSRSALSENCKRLEAQLNAALDAKTDRERRLAALDEVRARIESESAALKEQLAAALAANAGAVQACNASKEACAGIEAELSSARGKAADLELRLQDLAARCESERAEASARIRSGEERLAAVSAELASYKRLEASFSERMKWALKGAK